MSGARTLEENLAYRVSILNFLMGRATGEILQAHGVSNQQWKLISVLDQIAPASAQEVTGWVTLDKSAVSRTVRSLMEQGLVSRKLMGADARIVHLMLSPRGKALHRRVAQALGALQGELTASLPSSAQRVLFESLRRVESRLRERQPDGPYQAASSRASTAAGDGVGPGLK